jgi:hypothetical protein
MDAKHSQEGRIRQVQKRFSQKEVRGAVVSRLYNVTAVKPLTPELNPSSQRCLTRFFTGEFAP